MFKNFFLLIYFLIIFLPVSAENINKIIINGNERISDETIKLFGGINIDKNYDAKYLNQIIIDLYDTNYFENISLDINDGTLEISVVENPIIQNLIFEGIKSKKITALLKEVTLSNEKRPYIESEIINDVNNINTQLKNIGYYFATVEPTVNKVGNNLVDFVSDSTSEDGDVLISFFIDTLLIVFFFVFFFGIYLPGFSEKNLSYLFVTVLNFSCSFIGSFF
jgi:outer membrane protein insertion porin family